MRWRAEKRQGIVAVVVAVSLVTILGVVAIALDGGLLLDNRRSVQAAADATALAAAADLYGNWSTNQGLDKSGTAKASALSVAEANGYANDGTTSVVTVNLPPNNYLGGPNKGKPLPAGYGEVIIQYNQKRGFSSIFGSGDLPVKARAVARGRKLSGVGILVLNPTLNNACLLSGPTTGATTNVVVTGGGTVCVDSNNVKAVNLDSGCTITADTFNIVGTIYVTGAGARLIGTIVNPSPLTPDPLAAMPQPDPNNLPGVYNTKQTKFTDGQTHTLDPGYYGGGISANGGTTLILNPGIYYVDGSFLVATGANVKGSGVMIFCNNKIDLSGAGTLQLSPPTTGTYSGIAIFEDRSATSYAISLHGSSNMSITGALYMPSNHLKIVSDSSATIASQVICNSLEIAGSGTLTVDYKGKGAQRDIRLAE